MNTMFESFVKLDKMLTSTFNFETMWDDICCGKFDFKFPNPECEVEFWYRVLYAIGSYYIDSYYEEGDDIKTDIQTRLFCGHWILSTIANIYQDIN